MYRHQVETNVQNVYGQTYRSSTYRVCTDKHTEYVWTSGRDKHTENIWIKQTYAMTDKDFRFSMVTAC